MLRVNVCVFLLAVAALEVGHHVLDAQPLGREEHDEVIEQVAGLVDESAVGAVHSLEGSLHSLLAHLLGHAVDAGVEERGGVAALGHLGPTLVDEVLQVAQKLEAHLVAVAKAGGHAQVAHSAVGYGLHQHGIAVAVHVDRHELQVVAAFLALGPQLVAGAAPEGHLLGLQRFFKCLVVHKAKHEHIFGARVLHDGRNQATHFVKVDIAVHLSNVYNFFV